jgi:hypothetical protein
VLGTRDPELDAGEGEREVRADRGGHVGRLATALIERSDGEPDAARSPEPSQGGAGANDLANAGTPTAREARHRPVVLAGKALEAPGWVQRPRLADDLQEGDVLVPVGVAVGPRQVDTRPAGQLLHRLRLGRTPEDVSREEPAEVTLDDLDLRAQDVLDREVLGERRRLIPGRRGGQRHGVPSPVMGLDELPGLRIHHAGDPVVEEAIECLRHLRLRASRPVRDGDVHELVHVAAADGHLGRGEQRPRQLGGAELEVPRSVLVERRRRVAGDQGPVEIEEGADLGSLRAGFDLGQQLVDGH